MRIIFASNNKNKINEFKKYFKNIEIVSLKEVGIDIDILLSLTTVVCV